MTTETLGREDVESVVGTAVLAPSALSTQPWLFRVRGELTDVHLDASRTPPVLNPTGRVAVISCRRTNRLLFRDERRETADFEKSASLAVLSPVPASRRRPVRDVLEFDGG